MTAATLTRPLPEVLAALRAGLLAAGWTATSDEQLSDDGERFAREDRMDQ